MPIIPALILLQVHRHVSRKSESDQLAREIGAENTLPSAYDSIENILESREKRRTRMKTPRCEGLEP